MSAHHDSYIHDHDTFAFVLVLTCVDFQLGLSGRFRTAESQNSHKFFCDSFFASRDAVSEQ